MPEKVFKYPEALSIFVQILKGLKAIHHENIIHRDLKCENILLKKIPKQQNYICKIGDFGFAKELSETAKSHCGTPNFMAPEILSEKPYDKSVDIWAIGVIFYYMLFGDYPFKGLNLLNDIENKCA
jgi:serine/threonine protein kinase